MAQGPSSDIFVNKYKKPPSLYDPGNILVRWPRYFLRLIFFVYSVLSFKIRFLLELSFIFFLLILPYIELSRSHDYTREF
jgi:hypothetical protein